MLNDTSITGVIGSGGFVSDLERFMSRLAPIVEVIKPTGRVRRHGPHPARGKTYKPNGARECARRMRQDARIAERVT